MYANGTSINLLCGQIAVSRARSILAYLSGMWLRHNLKVSLHRNTLKSSVLYSLANVKSQRDGRRRPPDLSST